MDDKKIRKTDEEWRKELTPEQYRIARQKGTERAFTGEYNASKEPGTYTCVCCGAPLFDSDAKFDSGSGWPSFTEPVTRENVRTESDTSMFMRRTEVLCAKCDAHPRARLRRRPRPYTPALLHQLRFPQARGQVADRQRAAAVPTITGALSFPVRSTDVTTTASTGDGPIVNENA